LHFTGAPRCAVVRWSSCHHSAPQIITQRGGGLAIIHRSVDQRTPWYVP
jgi:hypothetical protein